MTRAGRAGIFLVVFATVVVGCGGFAKNVRKITYPPDFTYVPREKVQSAMWQLAAGVRELDRTLRDQTLVEPERQQRVLAVLARMDSASSRIVASGEATNHPLLDRELPELDADIAMARRAASAEPPNYTLVSAVSGACIYCHASRVPGVPAPD